MFIVWIIATALDSVMPTLIELAVWVQKTARPADNKKAKKVCLVEQPESTYG